MSQPPSRMASPRGTSSLAACTVQVLGDAVASPPGIDEPKINAIDVRHGEYRSTKLCDYTSENTQRLGVDATKELPLRIPEIQRMVGALA
jgi:hypothetical protein